MPSNAVQQPRDWRPMTFPKQVATEPDLERMGFDVHRLAFYAWLVSHGLEPTTEPGDRTSSPRSGRALES